VRPLLTEHDRQRPRDGRGIDKVIRTGHRSRVEARPTNLASTVAFQPVPVCPGEFASFPRAAGLFRVLPEASTNGPLRYATEVA
jgi:hypothetical protein